MEAIIENGFVKLGCGEYLAAPGQPVACRGEFSVAGLRGFVVPDRTAVRKTVVRTKGANGTDAEIACFASSERPFLTRLDALPDEPLNLVSAKLLVAPFAARTAALSLKLIPFSFQRATAVTSFVKGWVVAATKSRVMRSVLGEGETLTVRPEALVGWTGKRPTGFCPKLGVLDILLPRGPRNLAYSFHGPAVVWFEGGAEGARRIVRRGGPVC